MALTMDKCKSCGAPLDLNTAVDGVVRCAFCRNTYTVVKQEPAPEDEKRRESEKLKKQKAEEEYRQRQNALEEEVEKLKALTSQYTSSAISDGRPEKVRSANKKQEKTSAPRAKTQNKPGKVEKEIFSKASKYITANAYIIAGLNTDGTVTVVGDEDVKEEVSGWRGIVAVSANTTHLVGLKADGSVVSAIMGEYCNDSHLQEVFDVSGWRGIVAISAGDNNIAGLKRDGTVVAVGNETVQKTVSGWRDIAAVSAGDWFTVGLKSDGTVVVADINDTWCKEAARWRDIVFVTGGGQNEIAGLKRNGKFVPDNYYNDEFLDAKDWRDLVAVCVNDYFFVGLKSDGTVVSAGEWETFRGGGNAVKVSDVTSWRDIIAISACYDKIVGLKSDGSVVAIQNDASFETAVSGEVKDWKLFNNVNELK